MKRKKRYRSYYCLEDVASETRIPLSNGDVFGRKEGRHVFPKDRLLSGKHATITMDSERNIFIEDHGSRNFTFVNSQAIEPHIKRQIFTNDTITLGQMTYRLAAIREKVENSSASYKVDDASIEFIGHKKMDRNEARGPKRMASAALSERLPVFSAKRVTMFSDLPKAIFAAAIAAPILLEADFQLMLNGPSLTCLGLFIASVTLFYPLLTYSFRHGEFAAIRQLFYVSAAAISGMLYWYVTTLPIHITRIEDITAKTGNCASPLGSLVSKFHSNEIAEELCRVHLITQNFAENHKSFCRDSTESTRHLCLIKTLSEVAGIRPFVSKKAQDRLRAYGIGLTQDDCQVSQASASQCSLAQAEFRIGFVEDLLIPENAIGVQWIKAFANQEASTVRNLLPKIRIEIATDRERNLASLSTLNHLEDRALSIVKRTD